MKFLAVLLLFVLAYNVNGFWVSERKCGEKLTQIMWIVCDNNFNSMMDKRSGSPALDTDIPYPYASSASLANIFQIDAGNLLAKTRRMRMSGIADECCRKSCTLNELASYCN